MTTPFTQTYFDKLLDNYKTSKHEWIDHASIADRLFKRTKVDEVKTTQLKNEDGEYVYFEYLVSQSEDRRNASYKFRRPGSTSWEVHYHVGFH